jgi:hypothetical protein
MVTSWPEEQTKADVYDLEVLFETRDAVLRRYDESER